MALQAKMSVEEEMAMVIRPCWTLAGVALGLSCGLTALASGSHAPDLVVHEWGTFLVMQGSDGATLDGMYHEAHALPDFVHARSRDQLRLASAMVKGETPVIYFYTPRRQQVTVRVDFPTGIWTQWYPQASLVAPQFTQAAAAGEPANGSITWRAEILPAATEPAMSPTGPDALWNHSRAVDAAFVRTRDDTRGATREETERFLFYRGLGTAPLPVRMTAGDGGTLEWTGAPGDVESVLVLRVEDGRGAWCSLPAGSRATGVIPDLERSLPLPEFAAEVSRELERRLAAAGLYPREARAMVETWRSSYFESPGTRALLILSQEWTDRFIPLAIHPRPKETVRVMVARVELLTPERERIAEEAVSRLAAPDPATRAAAFDTLREQGRYVEPVVRRILATTEDAGVRQLCRQLLSADFVTDLRVAIHDAASGGRLVEDPLHVQARLAVLLRDLGRDEEARAEGRAVLTQLASRPRFPIGDSRARHHLRAEARALEATGDTTRAAQAYTRFVEFAGQVKSREECRACHRTADGPRDMHWYRDWWAGRRYAQLVDRAGGAEAAIAQQRAAASRRPDDPAPRMLLSYLYEQQGRRGESNGLWARLAPPRVANDPGGTR
jgi:hypothetical protein